MCKWLHKDSYRTKIPPTTAIFQIMLDRPSEFKDGQRDYFLIGTGFIISKYGLFLTAAHVLQAKDDNDDPRSKMAIEYQGGKGLVALITSKGTAFPCPIVDAQIHPTADIALGMIVPPDKSANTPPFAISVCAVSKEKAVKGDKLVVYGYQRSHGKNDEKDPDTVHLNLDPKFYDGHVIDYHPGGYVLAKWPIYETSVPIPGGVSGGPFQSLKNQAVIGVSCFSGCTKTEDVPNGMVTDVHLSFEMELPERLQRSTGQKTVHDLLMSEGLLV